MKNSRKKWLTATLSFALVAGMVSTSPAEAAKKPSMSKKTSVTVGKKTTLKVKNAKKAVKWKVVSGKKKISLKKKGKAAAVITGKKKGTAKVRATVGKIKLNCIVTVKAAGKKTDSKDNAGQGGGPIRQVRLGRRQRQQRQSRQIQAVQARRQRHRRKNR